MISKGGESIGSILLSLEICACCWAIYRLCGLFLEKKETKLTQIMDQIVTLITLGGVISMLKDFYAKNSIIYSEYPYVSSTCFLDVYPGSTGYWICDKFAVLKFLWNAGNYQCNFTNTQSYKVYPTYESDNVTIMACNILQ